MGRTAVKLGHCKALAGLRPVDLEPIRIENVVIRVRAHKGVVSSSVTITLVSHPPYYVILSERKMKNCQLTSGELVHCKYAARRLSGERNSCSSSL